MKRPSIPRDTARLDYPGQYLADYLVDRLFYVLGESQTTYKELAKTARISEETLKKWRTRKAVPKLDKIGACFGVLGYQLCAEKTAEEGESTPYYPIDLDWWKIEKQRRNLADETE